MNRELLFFASSWPVFVSKINIFVYCILLQVCNWIPQWVCKEAKVQKVFLQIYKYDMGFEAIRKLLHKSGDHTPKYL